VSGIVRTSLLERLALPLIPANAGIQILLYNFWVPACAGTSGQWLRRMKHVLTIIAGVVLIGMLVWLYFYAPCGVFYWNNAKDVPERCQAELGRRA
jgi:hypothetical protein